MKFAAIGSARYWVIPTPFIPFTTHKKNGRDDLYDDGPERKHNVEVVHHAKGVVGGDGLTTVRFLERRARRRDRQDGDEECYEVHPRQNEQCGGHGGRARALGVLLVGMVPGPSEVHGTRGNVEDGGDEHE